MVAEEVKRTVLKAFELDDVLWWLKSKGLSEAEIKEIEKKIKEKE